MTDETKPEKTEKPSFLKRVWAWSDPYILGPLRDSFLDTRELPAAERWLVWLGYAILGGLILCTLALETLNGRWPHDQWSYLLYTAEGITRQLTWVAVAATSVGFATGWAYLFIGAGQARWFITATAVVAWTFTLLIGIARPDTILPDVVVLGLTAVLIAFLVFAHRRQLWGDWGHALFGGLTALLLFAILLFWFTDAPNQRGLDAYALFSVTFYLTEPFWIILGIALIQFGMNIAGQIVERRRQRLSETSLRRRVLLTLFVQSPFEMLIGGPLLFLSSESGFLHTLNLVGSLLWYDGLLGGFLAFGALIALVTRRWNARTAALFLAVRITFFFYAIAYILILANGFDLSNPFYAGVDKLQILPPATYFMISLILGVLAFFVPFTSGDSPTFPQHSRIPLAFGASILTTTVIFFYFQSRDVATGAEISSSVLLPVTFYLGSTLLGLPYLLYTAVRHPDRLIGEA